MIASYKTILTIFAHPDDETLAAGATIKRLTSEGCRVFVAIPNTGIHSRRNALDIQTRKRQTADLHDDCIAALSILGVNKDDIFRGPFADNEIDKHTLLELIHWIEPIIDNVKPDIIFTHHRGCTNIDHQYCHEGVIVATRPAEHFQIPVLCGEVPSSTGYLKPVQWEPNFFVAVSEQHINSKVAAMQSYKSEAMTDPHPRSPEVLKALAKVRGSESGNMFAEAFMINTSFY